MANNQNLKDAIAAVIKENGNNEITGQIMQQALNSVINQFGFGSIFKDVATPATNPGNPDQNVFYIAFEPGNYPNFGVNVSGNFATINRVGSGWVVKDININLSAIKSKVIAGIGGNSIIVIDANGGVATSPGNLFVQPADGGFIAFAGGQSLEPVVGTNAYGLNWLMYNKIDQKIRLYNYTAGTDISTKDFVLLGYLYDPNVSGLQTLNFDKIQVDGHYKVGQHGEIYFNPGSWIDKANHIVYLSSGYYFGVTGFTDFGAHAFNYDPGLILQTLVFDPDRLRVSGQSPFSMHNVTIDSRYPIDTPYKISVAQIVSNNIVSKYGIDEVSQQTVGNLKIFYGQRMKAVKGAGTIDLKPNGDTVVTGIVYAMNEDGNYLQVAPGTNPTKGGGNISGLNWVVYNNTNAKIYTVNYQSGMDRETESVIGYIYDYQVEQLSTFSKISVNGVYPGGGSVTNINNSANIYNDSDLGLVQFEEIGAADYSQLMIYSQSLGMGWEAPEAILEPAIAGNYMIGDKIPIGHGNNGANVLNPLISTTAVNCGEPPMAAALNAFSVMYRRFRGAQNFIGTTAGEGGQSIEQLSKECTNVAGGVVANNFYHTEFLVALNRTKATVDALGKTVELNAIMWMQGEYNYVNTAGAGLTPGTNATSDKNTYKALLLTLKNNMQADVMAVYGQSKKPLFFMYQVAGAYISRNDMSINMAMIEFANENEDAILMNPTYQTPDYGGGHLSTNGYRWYGEYIAKSLYNVFVKGKRFKPVLPEKYALSGNNVIIDVYAPVLPLVIDTWTKEAIASSGFRVVKNGAEVAINSVSVNGNQIVLATSALMNGTIELEYAGVSRFGTGNVRDSDTWRSLYNYYDDRITHPEKPENYTPLDKPGGVKIYGKPYPMQNWLSNFSVTLNG